MNPLLSMLVVALVFSHLVKGIPQYHLFVLAGVLTWSMCTVSIVGGTHSLVSGGHLLRKVKIQAWIFPTVPVGMAGVNFCLSLVPFVLLSVFSGNWPTWSWLLLPVLVAILLAFLLGLALILSTANVFFRDIGHVLEPLLSLAFYGTPIIYDRKSAQFPEWVQTLLAFNPFTHFVEVFRAALLPHQTLRLEQLGICVSLAFASLTVGAIFFKKSRNNFMLEL